MGDELELPDEVFGFGSWLLWLVATRATELVDKAYETGPARPSRKYGMAGGHHVPTPSLIAWLLTAAESGVPVADLARRDPALDERQKVLRTMVSRAIAAEPQVFKDSWVRDLGAVCGLSDPEVSLLLGSRGDGAYPVDPAALATAIERTLRARAQARGGPGGAAAATRTLPRDIAAFTGRSAELRELITAAGAAADSGPLPRIYSIGGMPGVGKTAFAIHAAHLLAPRFPDGQIFVSLHGHTPAQRPADPADALASLLLTVGVTPGQIPPGSEPRMALWRDQLAGKRVLLVLDDAAGHDQVAPLLPGESACMVLVTSRRRLTALPDAHAISLDTLPADEAAALFVRLAGRPGLSAPDAAPDVADLVRMCGYLPLAVGMLARQLHHHPAWSPATLAADLAAARSRLSLMTAENLSVAAAFGLSYAGLAAGLAALFRRLGLFPGSEVDAWAAAALTDTDPAEASRGLNALYDHHLLTEPAPGRFRLHDLVREYAAELAATDPPAGRDAAMGRLTDYYLRAARAAGRRVTSGRRRPVPVPAAAAAVFAPEFAAEDAASRWLEAERLNLDAVIRHAAGDHPAHAVAIMAAIHQFLARGYGDQGTRLARRVLAGAASTGDLRLQGWALIDLAAFQRGGGDLRAAAGAATQALALFGKAGERAGEADARLLVGWLRYLTDDYAEAADSLNRALELYRGLDDSLGEAEALSHLGYLGYLTDNYSEAAASLERVIKICAAHDDVAGERGALNQLALVQQETGDLPAAAASFGKALSLSLAMRDRHGEAAVRTNLGRLQCVTGEAAAALATLTAALELHQEVGNRLGEATALNYLGLARRLTGDPAAAVASQRRAIDLYRDCGSRLGEANAWQELGMAQAAAGERPAAWLSEERALELYRQIGETVGQAETLNNMGDLHLAADDGQAARASYERALALVAGLTVPAEQARARDGIARARALAAKSRTSPGGGGGTPPPPPPPRLSPPDRDREPDGYGPDSRRAEGCGAMARRLHSVALS